MNRIIKFRGKTNAGWLHGDLVHREKETYIFSEDDTDSPNNYEVVIETVGQFTGLCDKNGTEIYEGDIITINGKYPKLVKYIDDYACFCLANICDLEEDLDTGYWHQVSPGWWNNPNREIKVVGNIYDNPQLINL